MQLTIDSNDDIQQVLTVVGALLGVQLQAQGDEPAPVEDSYADSTAVEEPAVEEAAATEPVAEPESEEPAAAPRRRRGGRKAAAAAPPSTSAVRAWARENGHEVSDRGRISAAVLSAYEQAHN